MTWKFKIGDVISAPGYRRSLVVGRCEFNCPNDSHIYLGQHYDLLVLNIWKRIELRKSDVENDIKYFVSGNVSQVIFDRCQSRQMKHL